MSLQPGMPPAPAGAWIEQEVEGADPDAQVRRDEDGEPVGRSDVEADAAGRREEDPSEQALNQDALDAFAGRDERE